MRLRIEAFVIAVVVAGSTHAYAQAPDATIRSAVKDGDKVRITADGDREFTGRIVAIGAHGLTLSTGRVRADVPYEQITRIDRQRDSLRNGALIGLGIGVGLGIVAKLSDNTASDDPFCGVAILDDCGGGSLGGYLLVWSGVGTLVGTGVDALIHRNRTLYQRRSGTEIVFAPTVGRRSGGVRLSIAW